MKEFTASKNDAGMRLSRFVLRVTWKLPNSFLYKAFRNGRIKVNHKKEGADYRIAENDLIQLYINDEFFTTAAFVPPAAVANAQVFPASNIVYEDENFSVLYKPAGMLSHADSGRDSSVLEEYIAYLHAKDNKALSFQNRFSPALCNRLDRGTEGLLIIAQQYAALRDMNTLLQNGFVDKIYLCICHGAPPPGVHAAHWKKDSATNTVFITHTPGDSTKPISTQVDVLEEKGGLSLCRVQLLTGRSHQIRAHLAFLGHPILGDRKYGLAQAPLKVKNQLLCAYQLCFANPLPVGNILSYTAGKCFTSAQNNVLHYWKTFTI